jgi:D-arabinose 1-dehydrogenase-like Zn-dependent alcohol dehydrogenase
LGPLIPRASGSRRRPGHARGSLFGKPLVVEEVVLDPLGPGELKVAVAACAICHSDIIYAEGGWGGALPAV